MRRLCASAELRGTTSIRFELQSAPGPMGPAPLEGFALRGRDGTARGYLNVCAHRGQPVDLGDGRLFSPDGTLECQAHGAHFDPLTGACVAGPCQGSGLLTLALLEHEDAVWLLERPAADDPEDDPDQVG